MRFDKNAIEFNSYYDNDKLMSIFWNTLSMKFPKGEQFFVKSVLHYKDRVRDPQTKADLDGFVRQEAQHTISHIDFNNGLKAIGYPTEAMDKLLEKHLGALRKRSPLLALHITAILEHYTSILGMQLLDQRSHNDALHGEARKIWLHHAVEEFEHRSVSFDVLKEVGGPLSDEIRRLLFIPVSAGFAAAVAVAFAYNLKHQNATLSDLKSLIRLIDLLAKNREKILDWFDEEFHPSQHMSKRVEDVKAELGLT